MKVVIGNNTYSTIDNLKFSPQTDLTADQLPINEIEVRLFTNDIIAYGQYAYLYDDLDNLWAKYWISYAERIGQDVDRGTYIVRLIAQSSLAFLERVKLPAKMYNTTASNVLSDILTGAGQSGAITLDTDVATSWASSTIQGFCPEQTARERLQWLLLCAGGYIKSFFDTGIKICNIDLNTNTLIPLEKTFWKPSISHRDYVTQIKITAYEFAQGLPHNYDEYVTDGTYYWVVSKQVITISNNNVPSGIPENIIEISDVTMVSPSTASTIAQNLVAYYFNRMEVDCDVVDNAEYLPGDLVTVYTDEDKLCTGYIDQADFSFGVQARGSLHLTAAAEVDGAMLTLQYKWGDINLTRRSYFLPKNYEYEITTEYVDINLNYHRYIFRPTPKTVSGTLTQNTTVNVACEVALDHYRIDTGLLEMQSIDNEYNALYTWLEQYYQPKIREESKAGESFEEVRRSLQGVYIEKKSLVNEQTNFLHVINVDEVVLDTSAEERAVDIS